MNLKIYRMTFTNYNDSSEPYREKYTKLTKKNFEALKKECEKEFEECADDMAWRTNDRNWWSYNDDDCLYATITIEDVLFNADGSSDMETE